MRFSPFFCVERLCFFRNQTDAEIEGSIVKAVLLRQTRPAAGRADAVLCIVKAENGAVTGMQLIVVRLFSQLFLRVVRGVEAERLCTDSGKLDASAIQLDIIAIIVTAVLLRADVVLVLLPDGGTEVAVAGSMVLVAVAFHRTHAEVTDAGHFFWQEQAQAKARQFGEYRVALSVQCQRYCTAVGNRPADIQIKEFLQADKRYNAQYRIQPLIRWMIEGEWNEQRIKAALNQRFSVKETAPEREVLDKAFWELSQEIIDRGLPQVLQQAYDGKLTTDDYVALLGRLDDFRKIGVPIQCDVDDARLLQGFHNRKAKIIKGDICEERGHRRLN